MEKVVELVLELDTRVLDVKDDAVEGDGGGRVGETSPVCGPVTEKCMIDDKEKK